MAGRFMIFSPTRRRFRQNGPVLYQHGVVFAGTAPFFTNTASFSPKRPRFRENVLVDPSQVLNIVYNLISG